MTPPKNPYEPTHLIEASRRALAAWDALTLPEQVAELKKLGILGADSKIHPDYDWTPERYAQEFGQGHAAK